VLYLDQYRRSDKSVALRRRALAALWARPGIKVFLSRPQGDVVLQSISHTVVRVYFAREFNKELRLGA